MEWSWAVIEGKLPASTNPYCSQSRHIFYRYTMYVSALIDSFLFRRQEELPNNMYHNDDAAGSIRWLITYQ